MCRERSRGSGDDGDKNPSMPAGLVWQVVQNTESSSCKDTSRPN